MLSGFISRENVFINLHTQTKEELYQYLAKKAESLGYVTSGDEFYQQIIKKDEQGITELKPHILLPHARGEFAKKLFVMIAISKKGHPFQGAKKNKLHMAILVGVPADAKDYLKVLASISRLLSKDEVVKAIINAEVVEDVIYQIKKLSVQIEQTDEISGKKYLVVLSLNQNVSSVQIAPLLTEVGVDLPTKIEGESLNNASIFMPFLSAFGYAGGISRYSRVYLGLTDEKEASAKLNRLLKAEGISLNDEGVGSLFQIEVMESYGGFSHEVNF